MIQSHMYYAKLNRNSPPAPVSLFLKRKYKYITIDNAEI